MNNEQTSKKHTNILTKETSPYLQQHAHNPVNWYPWGPEALQKAKDENKPILVSIGYSACHWCHVMEHESFENEAIAEIMNRELICIKIDREERPDIDQIYMDAVQAMGKQGGWPLNVFLTQDTKPFYGGTYFPPDNWAKLCNNIGEAYRNDRDKLEKSAENISNGLNLDEVEAYGLVSGDAKFSEEIVHEAFQKLSHTFDPRHGGYGNAPKFPMPSIYYFLLRYYYHTKDEKVLDQIKISLNEIARGGIYDQIGGGFSRYSTDDRWFAPHFEKMMYDNGQLLSVYAEAYKITKDQLYKTILEETVQFIEREQTNPEGGFYSALDADSEGEEGKFYCWSDTELKVILNTDYKLFTKYYNTTPKGNWEHDKNILFTNMSDDEFAQKHELNLAEIQQKVKEWKTVLLEKRSHKIRPGLDHKILCSWNAITLTGLLDAYQALGEPKMLELAINNANYIDKQFLSENGKVKRTSQIDGFLEDYAWAVKAFIKLYETTGEEKWLLKANQIIKYTIQNFHDAENEYFYYTSTESEKLIARKKEIFDNVIPASNSVMCENLLKLHSHFENAAYERMANDMLLKIQKQIAQNGRYLSFWSGVYMNKVWKQQEIVLVGKNYKTALKELQTAFSPNTTYAGSLKENKLPLFENREDIYDGLSIYVCENKACKLPAKSVEEVNYF